MNCVNKLVLGTVQFGLDYGINNQFGQVHQDEVGQILRWEKQLLQQLSSFFFLSEEDEMLINIKMGGGNFSL